jgi:long-chain acyl-CoA synthetase
MVENLALTLARKIIFKKILDRFGGRLRLAVSGASALSAEVAEFVNDIGIGVYEGYGLSENSAALTMNLPGKRKFGSVGKPLPGIRIEIDSSVEGSKEEDGEVVAYGENIMKGYHNLPEQTSSTLTESRGLRTGDLGHLDEDGYLYITGRIKEQYKLENGKFVAPAPLEEELKLSPYITQAMIYGLNQEHNVALIVADMEKVRQFADEKGLSGSNPELLQLSEVRELFKKEVQQFSTTFKNFERIEDFSLLDEEWNPDNGLLTPTMKIKRSVIEEKFKENIESLYA